MTTTPSRNAPCPCGSGRKYKSCCLSADRAAAVGQSLLPALTEAATEHPWEVGVFPLPTLFDDQPGRRVSVVLVTAAGFVLTHDMLTEALGRIDEVVDVLESALEKAEERTGVRPSRVAVRHQEVARSLATRLAPRGVDVDVGRPLTGLEDAAHALCRDMLGVDVLPLTCSSPTWRGWGLSAAQCRSLFAAAARFRRAAPWERLDDEPVNVLGRHGAWTAAVMGSGGEEFGMTVYTEPEDFTDLMSVGLDLGNTLEAMHGAMYSISFEPRGELTREMQREVVAAGWEVADPAGYPVVFTTNTPAGGLDPGVADVLTAILLAIPDFLDACEDEIAEGLAGHRIAWPHHPTGLHLSYEVPGGFEWPVPDHLEAGGPQGTGADPAARITDIEEPGNALVDAPIVEAFEAHLRESVTEATAARHARNAEVLVEFLNGRHGVPLRALHEYDLRTFLYSEFPRLRPGYTRTESLPGSLRRFFAFLSERHDLQFPWAKALLSDRQSLERRVHAAPVGGWWNPDIQYFRADVWEDLDRRTLLLPDDWAGALEPEAFTGIGEARLHHEAQRRWLVWRDDLIHGGMDTPDELYDALGVRLLEWLDEPDPEDRDGRTRLAVIRAERNAAPTEDRRAMEQAFLGLGDEEG